MSPLFTRSKAKDYRDRSAGGLAGVLRVDSLLTRIVLFIGMSLVFFFFLRITEKKIPRGIVPDTTDTVQMHRLK